jgi:aquaporin TIP
MEKNTMRIYLIELVGTFGLVWFSAGLVCINQTTTPLSQTATAPLTLHQPGVFGVALGQGLILAALLALTAPVTGGYLNPAIALMLWVFNRIETPRAAKLIGTQLLGSALAALSLRYTFQIELLRQARFGAPHLNSLAMGEAFQSTNITGVGIELVLTFFLVFAIFGMAGHDSLKLGMITGMIMTVSALFALPLTGAALNPARWLGPALLEVMASSVPASPWRDSLVYLAGPIVGALLGGLFVFSIYRPDESQSKTGQPTATSDIASAIKVKK